MSVGFFYNVLDWTNKKIIEHIRMAGVKVEQINCNDYVLDIHDTKKFKHRLYVNRVYPSSNAKSYGNLRFMLEVTKHIENLNIKIINPFQTSFMDYSKTEGSNALEKADVLTPKAILVSDKAAALRLGRTLKFPKVVKMDAGGKALNVFLTRTFKEYKQVVSKLSKKHHLIHIEEYIETPGFITRVFVLDNKVVTAYKRVIGKKNWLGSTSQGSEVLPYPEIPKRVRDLGKRVARKVKSEIIGMDIIETKKKDYVIDLNPTPAFSSSYSKILGVNPPKLIAEYILKEHRKCK